MSKSDEDIYMKRSEIDNKHFDLFNRKTKYANKAVEGVQMGTEVIIPTILGVGIGYFISNEMKNCGKDNAVGNFLMQWSEIIFPIIGFLIGVILVTYDNTVKDYSKQIDFFSKYTIRQWAKFLFNKILILSIIFYLIYELNIIKLLFINITTPVILIISCYLFWISLLFINLTINFWNEEKENNVFLNYSDVFNTFFRLVISISVLVGLFFYMQGLGSSQIGKGIINVNAANISNQKIWLELPIVIVLIGIIAFVLKSYTYNKFTLELRNIINKEVFTEKCPSSYNINSSGSIQTTYVNQPYVDYYEKNYKKTGKHFKCTTDKKEICNLYARDFYWPCSYNTYSIDGTNFGSADLYAIKRAIKMGSKVLHLPVYMNDTYDGLVIGMKNNINNTNLKINETFKLISNLFWENNNENPLVLYLEIGSKNNHDIGSHYLDELYNSINKYFGNRLINSMYGYNGIGISSHHKNIESNHFCNIPIRNILGKVSILTNKYPSPSQNLNSIINGCLSCKNIEYITTIVLKRNEKISSVEFDQDNTISYNQKNITAILPEDINSTVNIVNSGVSLYNVDYKTNWEWGCQFVFMNYQLCNYKNKDSILINYINEFKDSPLVLKPEKLRYIPTPPVIQPTQSKSASWKSRNMLLIRGFHPKVSL